MIQPFCRFLMSISLFAILSVGLTGDSAGQDGGPSQDDGPPNIVQQGTIIVAEQDESGGAPRVMAFSALGGGEMPLMVGSPGMGFGMASAPLESLLMDQQIQSELELVDEQMEQIREIQKEMQEAISKEVQGLNISQGGFDPERMKAMRDVMQSIRGDAEGRINDVLLPHQTQRLDQLRRHLRMRSQGNGEALISGEIAKELDLSEAQIERIKKKAEELEKELAEEIRKLQMEAKEELFKELTPAQQDKLKELLGDNFVYQQANPRRSVPRRFSRSTEREEDR